MRANLVKALDALQKTRQKLTALEAAQQEPIAVIGLACRLPGAATPEAFWQLLLDGQDLVTAVPAARWDMDQYYDPVPGKPGKSYVRTGAFLDEVDSFDPQFFGISPREAMLLDPQQRLLLEVTWEALERAGQAPLALQQSKTGVFVGVSPSDYGTLMDEITGTDTYASTGNGVIFASGRLSHFLGLQGPNLVIDTACSASLIGVHLACESLRNRSSDLALAGGVHLMLVPQSYVLLSQLKALAPDGRSKTFDAAANGFGRGEGCGMVVLKRLSDAVAADDTILAVIRGSAINHDGHSGGLTVPSATAQAALIRQALEKAKVAPAEVGYVDAHGTGTALGDPIELRALAAVFGQRTTPLLVGTVKTNLGHLEEAAGVAGLIKVILSMQHGVIPPHLHLHQPTPHIDWDNLPIAVPTTVTPWLHPEGATKKIAGVSSFGMGGSNAHVVVEEAPPTAWTAESQKTALRHEKRPQHLLTLSAKNEAALAALAHRYQAHLAAHPDLALGDLCYTAYTGRSHFSHRVSLVAGSVEQMQQKLMLYSTGKSTPGVQSAIVPDHQAPPLLAFLFTGQGAQYVNMGRELYATEPTFRESIDRCDELLRQYLGESLLALLYPDLDEQAHSPQPTAKIDDTAYTQPALFAVEYALAQVWLAWGIQPDLLLGHSVGELVAACVAGIFSLEDGLKLVAARGRLMSALPQDGAMVSLMATEVQVQAAIGPEHKAVAIAAVNGPESVVISGKREPVLAIAERMAAAGVKTHQLTVSHAFHSPLMEPMLDDFRQVAATIVYRAPQIPLVSNVTGTLRPAQGSVTEPAEMTTPDYWVRHVRAAVRFADGVATLLEQGIRLFLEVGPKPVLSGMVQPVVDANVGSVRATAGKSDQSAKPNACLCLPSVRENQSDWQQMLESVGALYGQGIAIAWAGVDRVQMRRKLVLPTYPFQRQRYWIERRGATQANNRHTDTFAQLLADHTPDGQLGQLADLLVRRKELADAEKATVLKVLAALADESRAKLRQAKIHTMLYEVAWETQTKSVASTTPAPGRWLILADAPKPDGSSVGARLADQLRALGEVVELVTEQRTAHLQTVWTAQPPSWRAIVYLWALDNAPIPGEGAALAASQERTIGSLLYLVQTLTGLASQPPRLWVVTQGAQSLAATEQVAIAQTPLWGVGRTVTLEHGDLWGGLIDLDPNATAVDNAQQLFSELWPPTTTGAEAHTAVGEEQIAFRQGKRYVARLAAAQPARRTDAPTIGADGSYLITGGLGQLGLYNAQWLVDQGARQLILVGRHGVQTAAQQAQLDAWQAAGVTIQVAAVDVADEAAMIRLFTDIASGSRPLRGVIHAAGVGSFQAFRSLQWADVAPILRPKVLGGWHLHRLTADLALDFFVSYSSGAAIWGSKQQAHYGAANHFLDGLMAYRRSLGLPGLSIAWGLWHPTDLSPAEAATVLDGFATIGVRSFTAELGLAAQAQLLQTEASQITVADVDWARLQIFYTLTKPRRFLAEVARVTSGQPSYGAVEPGEVATPLTLRQKLEAAPAAERSALLLQHLRLELGKILGISPETIDLEQGLMDMGLDSLMAVEVRNRLSKSLQQRLPATLIFDYPTLHKLAAYLQSSLGLQWTNSTTAPAESTTAPVKKAVVAEPAVGTTTDLDTLSDEEAADLLTAKLAEMGLTS